MRRDWDESYLAGNMPWDTAEPAPVLVELCEAGRLPPGRALEIGSGTGTNARYLASQGYDVSAVDVSGAAIDLATAAADPAGGSVEFRRLDFLAGEPPAGPFDLVFDRGCFHSLDDPAEQRRFAERVSECLASHGIWVSLLGSTEGPWRDHGPPRRSARDVVLAVEPSLEIVELRALDLDTGFPIRVRGWLLLACRREVPAQPSTRRH